MGALGFAVAEERRSHFLGAGPRLGLEGEIELGGGFNLSAAAAGALLFGSIERDTRARGITTSGFVAEGEHSESNSTMAWNLGGQVAVGYQFMLGQMPAAVKLGYQAEGWFDVLDTRDGGGTNSGLTYGTDEGDFIIHGPFAALTFEW